MSNLHALFLECFEETKRQFPGSAPHVLKSLATRLYISMLSANKRTMSDEEVRTRYTELRTALQTIGQWPGLDK